jgi:sRNA-binding regulator protein Hfq
MDLGPRRDRQFHVQISAAEFIRLRDEKTVATYYLVNGQTFEGNLKWFDDHAMAVETKEMGELTIFRSALLYIKAHR